MIAFITELLVYLVIAAVIGGSVGWMLRGATVSDSNGELQERFRQMLASAEMERDAARLRVRELGFQLDALEERLEGLVTGGGDGLPPTFGEMKHTFPDTAAQESPREPVRARADEGREPGEDWRRGIEEARPSDPADSPPREPVSDEPAGWMEKTATERPDPDDGLILFPAEDPPAAGWSRRDAPGEAEPAGATEAGDDSSARVDDPPADRTDAVEWTERAPPAEDPGPAVTTTDPAGAESDPVGVPQTASRDRARDWDALLDDHAPGWPSVEAVPPFVEAPAAGYSSPAPEGAAGAPGGGGHPGRHQHPLEQIAGVSKEISDRLASMGISTPEDLARYALSGPSQRDLADTLGVEVRFVRRWTALADLMRVPGVGPTDARLLEVTGLRSVGELAEEDPEELAIRMADLNRDQSLGLTVPELGIVAAWIRSASSLTGPVRA